MFDGRGYKPRPFNDLKLSASNLKRPQKTFQETNALVARFQTGFNRPEAIDNIELPQKITVKELEKQAAELTGVMKNSNPDKKRSIVRKYVANIEADPKARALKVSMYANFLGLWLLSGSIRKRSLNNHINIKIQFNIKSKKYSISLIGD